jgi:DNA/RNA-binding domain of Phe-tRNA-synthetase-like protein
MSVEPTIAPDIFALRPDFAALSIYAEGVCNSPSDAHSEALLRTACLALDSAPWAEAHLASWRDTYRAFGAKPQRTPCSVEALRKRAQRDRMLPTVNAVVDLYNALSLRYALPVGGEDAALYEGSPRLIRASGDEPFDTVAEGVPKIETAEQGEVAWRDDRGITCRRWNWRQGIRTRITEHSTQMWFVLERLEPMSIVALLEAGDKLVEGLQRLSPDVRISRLFLDASGTSRHPGEARQP